MRGCKLPRVIRGSTGSTKEICETSGLPIPMVPRLHQCNGYIKRKLRAWRVQKCIALVGADIALTSAGPQTTPCHGGQYRVHQGNIRNFGPTNTHGTASAPMQWLYQKEAMGMESSKMYCPSRCRYRTYQCGAANYIRVMGGSTGSTKEISEISGLTIPMVPRLHQCNGYIKRKQRAWRVQKCIALVGADIALTSAGPQTTPCHGGQYRVHQGNMRNFWPTNTHGTASAPMQWLYQKEATGMESSKIYCPSRYRYRTHQCGAANYPVSWGAVQGPPRKYAKLRAYQYPWYRVCTNAMVISKGSYGHGEFKNVLP